MKVGVVVFPGSNCDRDALTAVQAMMSGAWGAEIKGNVQKIWHGDSSLPDLDLVILPGGFSYGDYLRSGAMAARSPIMTQVKRHADAGRMVLGICNGFQVLTESGLLPGTLLRNRGLSFICKQVALRVEQNDSKFTKKYQKGQVVHFPVAHHDGNYFADAATIEKLEANNQVLLRYADDAGNVNNATNINGSINNIAGIINAAGNVAGMMPHPERVCDALTGGVDGRELFLGIAA